MTENEIATGNKKAKIVLRIALSVVVLAASGIAGYYSAAGVSKIADKIKNRR